MVLDLRKKATSWADVQRQAESEISPPAVAEDLEGRPLVARRKSIRIEYLDPDTGEVLRGVIESEVPDRETREKIEAFVSSKARGRAWNTIPPAEQLRICYLAQCTFQIKEAPSWLFSRLGEDDELLIGIAEGLAAHVQRYFRADAGSGSDETARPRLVVDLSPDLS